MGQECHLIMLPWRRCCRHALLGTVLLTGCAPPTVTFIFANAERREAADRLRAVAFQSAFEARGLAHEQLVYEVRLYAHDRRPVLSRDGRYELQGGHVGAARSVMVLRSRQRFTDVQVEIPADELGLQETDLPALAEIGLYDVVGNRMAAEWRRLPVNAQEVGMPPPAPLPPDDRVFWFVDGALGWAPMLLGPYATEDEAARIALRPSETTVKIGTADYVWFVPMQKIGRSEYKQWIGPCRSETGARHVARTLTESVEQWRDDFEIGPPFMVRLGTWLARQKEEPAPDRPSTP